MKFTIGIVTSQDYASYVPGHPLHAVFESIANEEFDDDVEIIVVGGTKDWSHDDYRFIAFDESKKKAWITKKKNIITQEAKYENIVYMHDYIKLNPGWYQGFKTFGNDFEVCMTPIHNADGTRFRDWTLWPDDLTHILRPWNRHYLLPYEEDTLSKFMYFSGAYWIAKKEIMQRFPLDEALSWGESEDVKWSKEVRQHFKFKLNPYSSVRLLKQKDPVFDTITPEMLQILKNYENPQPK